jgi:hypothetical protein
LIFLGRHVQQVLDERMGAETTIAHTDTPLDAQDGGNEGMVLSADVEGYDSDLVFKMRSRSV